MKQTSNILQQEPNLKFKYHDSDILNSIAFDLNNFEISKTVESLNNSLSSEQDNSFSRINLIAAESNPSEAVRNLLSDTIGNRMGGGHIGEENRLFPGCRNIDVIEATCIESFKKLFNSKFCEHRLTSNMLAITLVYLALLKRNDPVMSFSLPDGGDTSNTPLGPLGLLGIDVITIPFDPGTQDIIWDEFEKDAKLFKPKIVAISRTVSLFEIDIRRIKKVIEKWGGLVFVDAAHELGLIAGKVLKNPLDNGADLMCGSIGKTFSGPQGGVLLWNNPSFTSIISKTAFPMLVSSYQINRVAASALAALELIEFGEELMSEVVCNAKTFANVLSSRGLPVFFAEKGFTETHQVLLDVSNYGGGYTSSRQLADIGIMSNQIISPNDGPDLLFTPTALRFGLVGITRLGMKKNEIVEIANIVSDLFIGVENKDLLKERVRRISSSFKTIYYNFENRTSKKSINLVET